MHNAHIVFLTADFDCDGTFYAAQRVTVPAHRVSELLDADALRAFMLGGDLPHLNYIGDAIEIMTQRDFLAKYRDAIGDAWDRNYFYTEGYSSMRGMAKWAPWAGPNGDDTIGIPALDTRYES